LIHQGITAPTIPQLAENVKANSGMRGRRVEKPTGQGDVPGDLGLQGLDILKLPLCPELGYEGEGKGLLIEVP
jgi:hypothetical protein